MNTARTLTLLYTLGTLIFLAAFPDRSHAADRIALTLPLEARFAPVTNRLASGAKMAVAALKAQGVNLTLSSLDAGCDLDKTVETATAIRENQSQIALGSLCFQSAKALAKALKEDGGPPVPVIAFDTRSKSLARSRDVDGLSLFSISAEPDAEARAVVELILTRWSNKPFAIADDGSVYGRSLADAIQLIGADRGIKPVVVGNFRPLQSNQIALLRRFQRSGVEALFVAAAPEDVTTIAQDLKSLNYDWDLASGEPSILLPYTQSATSVEPGLLIVRPREAVVQDPAVLAQINSGDTPVEDSLIHGYVMIEIAAQIDASVNAISRIPGTIYQTILGPVTFNKNGRANISPFALYRWNGRKFETENGS